MGTKVQNVKLNWECPVCSWGVQTNVDLVEVGVPYCDVCFSSSKGEREEEMEYMDAEIG